MKRLEKKLDQLRSSLPGSAQVYNRVYRADQALKERRDMTPMLLDVVRFEEPPSTRPWERTRW